MRLRPVRRALRPELALTTVSWIAALALLALNDHVLKHAGALPDWLTGKLSDFAGLYVAPALLATLLRVRSRSALALCHVAVGAGFAAINLDPGCAAWCVRALSAFGIHWRIVSDAADLIALPILLASMHWLGAAMTRDDAVTRVTRRAQQLLAVAGLACCMATSNDWEDTISSAGPHLHNPTGKKVTLLLRSLRGSVQLDCDAVEKEPGRMLPDAAFDPAVAFELDPHENLGTGQGSGGLAFSNECGALLVSGSRLSPVMLFWRNAAINHGGIPFTYEHEKDWQRGAIVLQPGHAGVDGYMSIGGDFVFAIKGGPSDDGESCALPSPAARPAFSFDDLPRGTHTLLDASEGADGCVELRFAPGPPSAEPEPEDFDGGTPDDSKSDGGVEPSEPAAGTDDAPASYLCIPHGMFPFKRGDTINTVLDPVKSELSMTRISGSGSSTLELHGVVLGKSTFAAHLDIDVRARAECDFHVRAGCAETAVATEIDVRTGKALLTLRGGEPPQHVDVNGLDVELAVPFAQWRAVVDQQCAEGVSGLLPVIGPDAILIAVVRAEEP